MAQSIFDEIIDRRKTLARKWDALTEVFGTDDILPMWIADMDFASPPEVVAAVTARAVHGVYGYASRPDSYFQAILEWVDRRHGWKMDRDWILSTPAVVTGISVAVQTFTEPGDGVIIQPPVYPPFFSCVVNNGRKVVENPLKVENGRYVMDFDDLENKMEDNVKMLVLCSPHNPVGRVWEREELARLGELCARHQVLILADEMHCDLVFKRYRHIPMASISPEIARNTITFLSPGKAFNLPGFYTSATIISDSKVRQKFNRALGALELLGGNIFGIAALEAAYRHGDAWLAELLDYLEGNADYLVQYFAEKMPAVRVLKPESTFLAWLDFREIGLNKRTLNHFFVEEAQVGVSDGRFFGIQGEGFARINFGCPRATLIEGLEKIRLAAERVSNE